MKGPEINSEETCQASRSIYISYGPLRTLRRGQSRADWYGEFEWNACGEWWLVGPGGMYRTSSLSNCTGPHNTTEKGCGQPLGGAGPSLYQSEYQQREVDSTESGVNTGVSVTPTPVQPGLALRLHFWFGWSWSNNNRSVLLNLKFIGYK